MTKRMLIDATHLEEKRVAVINDTKLEEFDYETTTKKQDKGNIYLAKVIRVEPSLQAAFIEYGGNRHGFLAFSEIHPDYYRIPIADRDQNEREEAAPPLTAETALSTSDEDGVASVQDADGDIEIVGGNEDERPQRSSHRPPRGYKIQDVIKRRQIMLVQVVKEERNAKGAALTTYLSLAGRYCVLMPNAEREGGVSRKITSSMDRKRLKTVIEDLSIPDNMGVIIRTAGMERSKVEIKRDFEYLLRLWDEIREKTLASTAPCLIYQEGDLIKRAIRDLYSRDVEEILIEGEEGYKAARQFMKMLMPSHTKKIHLYDNKILPIFHHYQVENMIDAIHSPTVQLKAGGYIVINPTEALVAIDVNSGRATRERHIEETALKTNLEAAEEIALQLRLRDLAGLIVIDFIDMEEQKNINAVERRLKESMAGDRARIQIGRISPFGLLELSRQRLRPSIIEASTLTCAHCEGTGHVRSTESSTLHVLRAIEEEGQRVRDTSFSIKVATPIAFYLLNQKRSALADLESKYNLVIMIEGDDSLIAPNFTLDYPGRQEQGKKQKKEQTPLADGRRRERSDHDKRRRLSTEAPLPVAGEPLAIPRGEDGQVELAHVETGDLAQPVAENGDAVKRRRRRRRRRRTDGQASVASDVGESEEEAERTPPTPPVVEEKAPPSPRESRHRGGRGRGGAVVPISDPSEPIAAASPLVLVPSLQPQEALAADDQESRPQEKRRASTRRIAIEPSAKVVLNTQEVVQEKKPAQRKKKNAAGLSEPTQNQTEEGQTPSVPKRQGWWKRLLDS